MLVCVPCLVNCHSYYKKFNDYYALTKGCLKSSIFNITHLLLNNILCGEIQHSINANDFKLIDYKNDHIKS